MTKSLEAKLYQLAHSEYIRPLKEYLDELVTENDKQTRSIDPHKDPHKISKKQGMTEGYLMLKELLDSLGDQVVE